MVDGTAEDYAALDPELVDEVLKVMKDIAAEGMTMIVVTHELNFALSVAHKAVFIDRGQIVETGRPTHVLLNPREERTRQFVSKVFMRRDSDENA